MEKSAHRNLNWRFFATLGGAFLLSYLPFVHIPFSWLGTFFHEISHGLAALLTGGAIEKIVLYPNGSGLCLTRGGNAFAVAFSGYVGAVIAGGMLYAIADSLKPRVAHGLAWGLAGLVLGVAALWGRDPLTLAILLILCGGLALMGRLESRGFVKFLFEIMGVFIVWDSLKAPLNLIDGRHYGDGATLADLTGIPELFWAFLWFGIGGGCFLFLWNINRLSVDSSQKTEL